MNNRKRIPTKGPIDLRVYCDKEVCSIARWLQRLAAKEVMTLRESFSHTLKEWSLRLRRRLGDAAVNAPVERKRHHRHVRYDFFPTPQSRCKRALTTLCSAGLGLVFLFSAVNLVSYGVEYAQHLISSAELRQVYYSEAEAEEPFTAAPTIVPTATPTAVLTDFPEATPSPAPASAPQARLPKMRYPSNPYGIIGGRFQKLRRQNEDIIGWLTISEQVDEAVVQRNNTYYLDRDYKGYHNKNGAIFLDEVIDLRTRPYTLMLYGHNMKSGLMFGGLRNFENPTYYHRSPFITFDTAYEDGRYVIFAVGTVSTDQKNWRYVNFAHLLTSSIPERTQAIASLNRFSVYNGQIDVQPEDQLLILVTCVDAVEDRRIVAARRIREGESEDELLALVKKTRLK